MTIFTNEPNSSFQSLSVYREPVTIKANDFPQPGDDWRMVHIQYGANNLTLCLTRPLDIYNYADKIPAEFPFAAWTPRHDELDVLLSGEWEAVADQLYDFKPLVTADQWEAINEPIEPNCPHCKRVAVDQQSCCPFHY